MHNVQKQSYISITVFLTFNTETQYEVMISEETKISKFLSLILRHQPKRIDLVLDKNGWAHVDELMSKAKNKSIDLTLEKLKTVVENNDKKRFIFSADFKKIRANQGHSVNVDLEFQEVKPPAILYHGTATRNLRSIKTKGLLKGKRHHVHLSADPETAKKVGMRYGKPVVLEIDTGQMQKDGLKFFRSKNGVWLTEYVSPEYIKLDALH